jgi:DNA-directed RNA polymerase beta subunit
VLEQGSLVLSKRTLDGLRAGELSFNDLVNTGVVEWIDAEEEEDLLVAPRPFDLPEYSPKHSRPINPAKVEWLNLGDLENKKEAHLSAEVQLPNGETVTEEFNVPLNYYQEDLEKLLTQQTNKTQYLRILT